MLTSMDGAREGDVPPQFKAVLRAQTAAFLLMRKLAASALRSLEQADIPHLILRGQALAEILYQPASSRPQTDIDILVPEDMGDAAGGALVRGGWQPVQSHPLLFIRNGIPLDVHIEPLGIDRIRAWAYLTPLRARDFFEHAEKGRLSGVNALQVQARVTLPYLCFHAMKHSFDRLIWLWDIALLARRVEEKGQWTEVTEGIRAFHLERPVFYALSYAHRHMDAPAPRGLLEDLRPSMDWRERQLFSAFMRHERIPFLAERLFARMQPDFQHRLMFWKETIFPRREIRRQIAEDDEEQSGFLRKRLGQIIMALRFLWRELKSLLR